MLHPHGRPNLSASVSTTLGVMAATHHSFRRWNPLMAVCVTTVVALTVVMTTGCSTGDDTAGVSATSTTTTAPTTTEPADPDQGGTPEPERTPPVGPGSLDTMTSPGFLTVAQPTAQLVGVRQSDHENFHRVVFDFDGPAPHVQVGYVDPPLRQPGSGNPVAVSGSAFLQIHIEPAATVDFETMDLTPTYTGPTTLPLGGFGTGAELVLVGEFEGNLVWAVGLDNAVPFAVGILTEPSRVVVDLFNPVS